MAYSLLVTCEQCGYENFPQHRFCGMCGAALRLPEPVGVRAGAPQKPSAAAQKPVAAATQSDASPLSGPLFLGLAEGGNENHNASYLLDDEEASSHRGRYLLIMLFIGALAVAGWHWREDLAALAARLTNGQANTAANVPGSTAQPSSSTEASPAPPTNPPQVTPSSAVTGPTSTTAPAGANSSTTAPPSTSAQKSAPEANDQNSAVATPQASQPVQSDQGEGSPPSNAAAKSETSAPENPPVQRASVTTAKTTKEAKTSIAEGAGDSLELEGEKYLYGNGVPQNCSRAQKSLLAAAQRSNAKAQNVLGTMYATGHCVGRDLPLAYHWFAKSLHQEPSNTRIEQDLQAIWNQMTPEERQLAMRSGQ
jgi:hypothetical protein